MAALFIDIDGTLVIHGTNDLIPENLEHLRRIIAAGHKVFLTMRRGQEFEGNRKYDRVSVDKLILKIATVGIPSDKYTVLYDVPSPRIVINDEPCGAICVATNRPWDDPRLASMEGK